MLNKKLTGLASACLITFSGTIYSASDFFDFDSTYWQNTTANYSDLTSTDVGFNPAYTSNQKGTATLYSATITATLNSNTKDKFNDGDNLVATFSAPGLEPLTLDTFAESQKLIYQGLTTPDVAEKWLEANADEIATILFAANLGTALTGADSANTESATVLDNLVLTPTKGKAAAKKATGVTITETDSSTSGVMSYTGYKNGDEKGKRYGITLGYDTDLSETLSLKLMLPYTKVDVDDSVNTSSHVLMPAIALSYKAMDTDDAQINVGINLQLTGTYSQTDLTDLGYLRYSTTLFGSYRYFMDDNLTLTGGVTLGFGKYTAPGIDDPTITKIFEAMGTDKVLGFGGLVEYDLDDQMGVDFYLSATHNFNSVLTDGKDHVSFGPSFRYAVMDTFTLNVGYRRTQKMSSDTKYSADTIMLNALYNF